MRFMTMVKAPENDRAGPPPKALMDAIATHTAKASGVLSR